MRIKEVSLILCMIFAVIFILPAVSAGNVIVKNGGLNVTGEIWDLGFAGRGNMIFDM